MSGIIYRISGPVVVAEGLENAKMYDVLKVGASGLIGEIIKLDNGRAIVQVYEDTTGLRPGEAVENTGAPLSVHLGPGLIGSIFDGIQRPLDKIKEKSGDFIARGVNVEPLDLKKKWEFVHTVKKGDKVKAGDIIGTVEESSLITHRVLLPIGVEGVIEEISSGKHTVNDIIATVATPNGKIGVAMSQKWPVRIPRPVQKKLPPNIPLITGQRIIDTLFPVAKGGTAAVPGPFGSGKCVTGDTPVIMSDGRVLKIEHLYEWSKTNGVPRHSENEELVETKAPAGLFSFTRNKIMKSETNMFYKGKSSSIIKVKTRTGRTAKITPVHKLFRINGRGEIVETMAKDLKIGDYIASARKVEMNLDNAKIDLYALENIRVLDPEIRRLVGEMARGALMRKLETGLSKVTLESLARRTKAVTPKMSWIVKLCSALGTPLPAPLLFGGDRWSNPVRLPRKMGNELAEFLGYYVSEGYIRGDNTVVFTNTDNVVLERYNELAKALFGIDGKIERYMGKAPNILILSRVVTLFLRYLEPGRVAAEKRIPECVMRSSDEALASFLTSYYIGDGSVNGGDVEFCTASSELQMGLSYALTRFGIMHTLSDRLVDGTKYYRIFVRGVANLRILSTILCGTHRKVGLVTEYVKSKDTAYDSIDIVPLAPSFIDEVYRSATTHKELASNGIAISNYISNEEHMGVGVFKKFANIVMKSSGGQVQLGVNGLVKALEYIYCDKVVSLEEEIGEFDVYDASLPESGCNFIGGTGGIVLHNTVIQHQLAKWSDSDIVVYVGCGERGNEMTEILKTFPELKDPKTGKPLMDRTLLIANTSNMPVAAREASVYTGITIAEYYRDMGYSVGLMADSTSRWAEALREISGRLEEMPGEEGYPAYLGRKVAEFYERAGRVNVLNGSVGSITAIGAVSPPGGDTSEPVSQNTLRVTRVFWALDAALANARHFPSINWLNSYSLYIDDLKQWYEDNVSKEWGTLYSTTMEILQKEAEINEIVQLVGYDALPEKEKMILDIAKVIREDYLQQSAFDDVDTFSSMKKQYQMVKAIIELHDKEKAAVERGVLVDQLQGTDAKQKIQRMKYTPEAKMQQYFDETIAAINGLDKIKAQSK